MFRKLFVCFCIMLTCTWILYYNTVHAHPGRTDAKGGHYNRTTGVYHYHNSGTSSSGTSSSGTSSSGTSSDDNEDDIYLIAGVVILVGICWILIAPDSCCLMDSEHISNPARSFLSERPTLPNPGSRLWLPDLEIDIEEMSSWRLQATYTFRF